MIIHSRQIEHGSSLTLSCDEAASLSVVLGRGGGSMLKAEEPIVGIWVPLRGRLQLTSDGVESVLRTWDVRITEPATHTQAAARGDALWIALVGGAKAWRRVLRAVTDAPMQAPLLVPTCYRADRALRREVIALARASANGKLDAAAIAFIDSIVALQSDFASAIERCPGRTYAKRRHVFLRLQRVRNHLATHCHLELDNDTLARMANYSPWHFIRAFRAAYLETPHAYLIDQRLQRAWELLRNSPLAIAEIAVASGFEDRCSFSRLFRRRFGTTAHAVRRQISNFG
jgi:AraC family transcriptional regulator